MFITTTMSRYIHNFFMLFHIILKFEIIYTYTNYNFIYCIISFIDNNISKTIFRTISHKTLNTLWCKVFFHINICSNIISKFFLILLLRYGLLIFSVYKRSFFIILLLHEIATCHTPTCQDTGNEQSNCTIFHNKNSYLQIRISIH